VIYVKADWWRTCTDGDASFGDSNPLWLYDHDAPMGPLPDGWTAPRVWQYAATDNMDRNLFLGSLDELASWAAG
jgi:hypothetical protein